MARPTTLDLSAAEQPWRTVPMDGANMAMDVVPLASSPEEFVIMARFPPGFVRDVPGGYHAAETFLVLEGQLNLCGEVVGRGDLTHVPAELVRDGMHTQDGCVVLAWFGGPATFLTPDHLGVAEGGIRTVSVGDATSGTLLETPEALWSVVEHTEGECVDQDLTLWTLEGKGRPGPLLARTPR